MNYVKCYNCKEGILEEVERDFNYIDDGIDWVTYECAICGDVIFEEEKKYEK